MNGAIVLAAGDIEVGHHRTATIGGLTFNVDTIYSAIIAGLIVFGLGFYMARRAQSGRPSKLQLLWETIVGAVQKQVESAMGPVAPFVVPLAVTLFMFILISNWLELIPSQHWLVSPSADINMTLALALLVVFWVHVAHIKQTRAGGLLQALRTALPGAGSPDGPGRDRQAVHAGPPSLRQHLRRGDHARPHRPDAARCSCGCPTASGRASTRSSG